MFSDVRMGKAVEIEEVALLVDEINHSLERNTNALLSLIRLKNSDEYLPAFSCSLHAHGCPGKAIGFES